MHLKKVLSTFILFFITISSGCNQQESPQKMKASTMGETDTTHGRFTQITGSLAVKPTEKFVTGQFNFRSHKHFVKVDPNDANKQVYLQKKTYQAFKAMADSAQKAGIRLIIVSGTRNFNYQKSIWDRKWRSSDAATDLAKANEILQFSSMPMTSRHHWGTDLDLNHLTNNYFASGPGKKEYEWLKAHANGFGFYQPYTNKKINGRTGYNEEKWHWSYLPLAGPYLHFYNKNVTNNDISGFEGSNLAPTINMVEKYVDGVAEKVKTYGIK